VKASDVKAPAVGDWYLVLKQIEHDGVAYLPLNHHLVENGNVPERVPSNGAKGSANGQSTVPVNVSGMIDTTGMTPSNLFQLYKCGAVTPVDAEKSHARLMEGRRRSRTVVAQMIPPVRRISSLKDQYEQATSVPLTVEGMQNRRVAESSLPSPFGR
jgi:hypothetical protein